MPRGVKWKITEEKIKEAEASSSGAVTKNGVRSNSKVNKSKKQQKAKVTKLKKGDKASKSNGKKQEENIKDFENPESTPKNSQGSEKETRGCRSEIGSKARRNISATFQEEDNEVTMNVGAEDMAFLGGNPKSDEDHIEQSQASSNNNATPVGEDIEATPQKHSTSYSESESECIDDTQSSSESSKDGTDTEEGEIEEAPSDDGSDEEDEVILKSNKKVKKVGSNKFK